MLRGGRQVAKGWLAAVSCLIASRLRGGRRGDWPSHVSLPALPHPPQAAATHRRQPLVVLSDSKQTLRTPMAYYQVFNLTFLRLVSSSPHGPPHQLYLPPTPASAQRSYRVPIPRTGCRRRRPLFSGMRRWIPLRSLLVRGRGRRAVLDRRN